MIKLTAPAFWHDQTRAGARLSAAALLPLSWLWVGAATIRGFFAKPYRSKLPVICIGNVDVGGTGKTPTAIALLDAVRASGLAQNPVFLTRGFGGTLGGPALFDNGIADSRTAGDEAVLLAARAPTIVSRNRVRGLKFAEVSGFDCVIVDDGFQNPHFEKTVSLLVFDGASGIGNGLCLPAGPLRETLHSALARADAAIIIGSDANNIADQIAPLPIVHARIEPDTGRPHGMYVAFAGIGKPAKFFKTLVQNAYAVAETVAFPDHHPYTDYDVARLERLATRHNARLITTEKDYVRLPSQIRAQVDVLPVSVQIDAMPELLALIKGRMRP